MFKRSKATSQRTHRVVWPFIFIVCLQALVAVASLNLLSTVRGYVTAESLWSKSLGNAMLALNTYIDTGEPSHYQMFLDYFKVNQLDQQARDLLAARGDPEEAYKLLVAAGNHPADMPGMIRLFRWAHTVDPLRQVINHWHVTDPHMDELQALAQTVYARSADASLRDREHWKQQLLMLHNRMLPETIAFSRVLGEASRHFIHVLLLINLGTALLLVGLTTWRMHTLVMQRRAFERALQKEKERAQIILASIVDAVMAVNANGRLEYLNPAAARLIGHTAEAAVGKPVDALLDIQTEDSGTSTPVPVSTRLFAGEWQSSDVTTHYTLRSSNGKSLPVALASAPLGQVNGQAGAVLVLHDRTREREYLDQLAWQAAHDPLTGLLNRREFERRLTLLLKNTQDKHASLLFFDVDQFKIVNDTTGHFQGDRLLLQLCTSLQSLLDANDTLARLGGDEFGVLLENCTPEAAESLAERLRLLARSQDFQAAGQSFKVGLSIGIVHLGGRELSSEDALRMADLACYAAKDKGRNRIQVYTYDDKEMAQRQGEMTWVQRIHKALDEDRFCLYAQPIYGVGPQTAHDRHVEVLLRLHDEQGTLIGPFAFIPAAERYGLMGLLDRWVINEAFAICATLSPELLSVCAINLSGSSLGDMSLIDYIQDRLALHAVAPNRICFEITETHAIANLNAARTFIETLRELGFRFSLDDFGAGMSSFTYLKHLPVDYLKIDGSFVKNLLEDPVDRATVDVINRLGHLTGKRTIAEFAETSAIIEALKGLGVDYVQGYAVSHPQPFTRQICAQWATELWAPEEPQADTKPVHFN
ncbi:EAL domain-containing protein [Pseudomonas luteola]|uniref:EAL domain-containing protein n=1 Tax=Pseudomonas luteola TaxID=47886 RepID=UPI00123B10B4|nr:MULTISPECIES: EAL domain-containing protein [Pseudomonas]MBA1246470.1 EAL domain-containing protein [Pseudomonas zeshuii]QEU27157.1 EAL domain-containing protein [Pseudomonas luteola]